MQLRMAPSTPRSDQEVLEQLAAEGAPPECDAPPQPDMPHAEPPDAESQEQWAAFIRQAHGVLLHTRYGREWARRRPERVRQWAGRKLPKDADDAPAADDA